jgi:hypothetical protein
MKSTVHYDAESWTIVNKENTFFFQHVMIERLQLCMIASCEVQEENRYTQVVKATYPHIIYVCYIKCFICYVTK